MQVYRLKNLRWFYPLNPQTTADALNEMRKRIQNGECLFYPLKEKDTGIYPFIIGDNKPFVLILPGGGYGDVCSLIEGYTVAIQLNKLGYNAFIGMYRVGKDAHYPNPQDDVARMIHFILDHAKEMHVDPSKYAVCGFSAGGHLAASWGLKDLGYEHYHLPKPEMMMLAYPVITMGEKTHVGSRKAFLGKDCNNKQLQDRYSIEKQIAPDYPKTYVWQCKRDKVVPIDNTELLAKALEDKHCEYQYMQVEGDTHGLGLGVGTPAEGWLEKAIAFWRNNK